MTEQEMQQFAECGLVSKQDYAMFKAIANDLDFDDVEARKLAVWTLFYRKGEITEAEYKSLEIYEKAKKDGRI